MSLSENLSKVLAQINKEIGEGTVITMDTKPRRVDVIPTGFISLDYALGVGGIPLGRIIEIYGHEQSGKSTLSQYLVAQTQKMGGIVAYVDLEHSLDSVYAERCGVDLSKLILSQPDSGETALAVVEKLVRSGEVKLIIVDSIAALVPQKEVESDYGASMMGVQARLMSQAMRKLTGVVSENKVSVIFTNQIRMKIGVMFGNPETTPGGLAVKFYSSIRMELRKSEAIKDGNTILGHEVKVKIVKNKLAPPLKTTTFNIFYDLGQDTIGNLLKFASDIGIVDKKGAFYSFHEERLGQGFANTRQFLLKSPDVVEKIKEEINNSSYFPKSEDTSEQGSVEE